MAVGDVTLAQLKTRVRSRGDYSSTYPTDSELTDLVNSSIADLWDLVVAARGDFFLPSTTTISVSPGTLEYALPTDFYLVRGVDVQDSGDWHALDRFLFSERNRTQSYTSTPASMRYTVLGQRIRFDVVPQTATVRVWYIPTPPCSPQWPMSADTDSMDFVAGWDRYVIVDVCAMVAQKEEADPAPWISEKVMLRKRILRAAATRDAGEPIRTRDVYAERARKWRGW